MGAMQGQQNFYNLRFRFFNNEPFRLSLELRQKRLMMVGSLDLAFHSRRT